MKFLPCLMLLALIGAGCAQNQPAAPPVTRAPMKLACDVFNRDAATKLLGADVEKGQSNEIREGEITVTTCAYSTAAPPIKIVTLLLRRAENVAQAEQTFQEAKSQSKEQSGVDPQNISNLGNAAYWAGGSLRQLNVLAGEYWIILSAMNWQGDPLPGLETAARDIMLKL